MSDIDKLYEELNRKLDKYSTESHDQRTENIRQAFDDVLLNENTHRQSEPEIPSEVLEKKLIHKVVNNFTLSAGQEDIHDVKELVEEKVLGHIIQDDEVHKTLAEISSDKDDLNYFVRGETLHNLNFKDRVSLEEREREKLFFEGKLRNGY